MFFFLRPPSGWLSLDRSVLDLVAQTIGAGSGKKTESQATPPHIQKTPRSVQQTEARPWWANRMPCILFFQLNLTLLTLLCPLCLLSEVRALCHHIATEPGQLSFRKGDILRVLSKADPDWLLCSLGSTEGLVPIIYVTLKSMEESLDSTGLGQCWDKAATGEINARWRHCALDTEGISVSEGVDRKQKPAVR